MVPKKTKDSLDKDDWTVNASSIAEYFKQSGKMISIDKIKEWMDEGGQMTYIDGFRGDKEVD